MGKKLDLTGQKFHKLTVIKEHPNRTNAGKVQWECLCDCGNKSIVISSKLKSGWSKSCGCLQVEAAKTPHPTHGMTKSPEWNSWRSMKKRCLDPNNISYPNYGGRGIIICDRWVNSFENFYNDMGVKPNTNYSIERIDNNGNYEPNNCRWASSKEQSSNRRNNRFITFNGRTKTLSQWAKFIGISKETLSIRINRLNWSIEKALTEPLRNY